LTKTKDIYVKAFMA